MKGNEWRSMRSTLSPAFTSSKIKLMVPFITQVGSQMNDVLKKKIKNSKVGYIDIEMRDLTTRYANDVIATCAFGVKVDSHADVDNEFYASGREITNFTFLFFIKQIALLGFPQIMKWLKIPLFREKYTSFFRHLVTSVMKDREENNIVRPDMIHLLIQAKKGQLVSDDKAPSNDTGFATVNEFAVGRKITKTVWTNEELIAQALIFFLAGFETVSSVMTFLLHEVGTNLDIQDKLVKEIREVDEKNGGKLNLENIQQMSYMDMVVSETLRKWIPVVFFDRVSLTDYNLGKPNKTSTKDYIVKKGTTVYFPAWAIHHDPKYWQEPEKFDPERFSEANRDKIKPFTYMPFGLGPRNCIGSRFALCEVKVMLYMLLKDLELFPCEKTTIPLIYDTKNINLRVKGGSCLRFKIRET